MELNNQRTISAPKQKILRGDAMLLNPRVASEVQRRDDKKRENLGGEPSLGGSGRIQQKIFELEIKRRSH